jgi:hypothetical protein
MKVICKITYSNGKIYIGKDVNDSISYSGSPNDKLIEKGFNRKQKLELSVQREIIWESESATDWEVEQKEIELIKLYKSNDPTIGYNCWPKVNGY